MAGLLTVFERKLIRDPLNKIGYKPSREYVYNSSFKDLLLCGDVELTQSSGEKRFFGSVDSQKYYECLCSSFQLGINRFIKQYAGYLYLKKDKGACPGAWSLVTLYYAAFFGVNELLKNAGEWCFFLNKDDVIQINSINNITDVMTPGTYLCYPELDGNEISCRLVKTEGGGGIHKIVWQRISSLLNISYSNISSSNDFKRLSNLKKILSGTEWALPSEIRNLWNYRDPSLFTAFGENLANKTLFYIEHDHLKWAAGGYLIRTKENEIFGIEYIVFLTRTLLEKSVSSMAIADDQKKLLSMFEVLK